MGLSHGLRVISRHTRPCPREPYLSDGANGADGADAHRYTSFDGSITIININFDELQPFSSSSEEGAAVRATILECERPSMSVQPGWLGLA